MSPSELELEARLITCYLFDRDAPDVLARRYSDAHGFILLDPATDVDLRLLAYARRRPWSWRYLDAAAGLLRPSSLLRRKVLLMTAILETSPSFALRFEPSGRGAWRCLASLCANAVAAAFSAGVGMIVFLLALRSSPIR